MGSLFDDAWPWLYKAVHRHQSSATSSAKCTEKSRVSSLPKVPLVVGISGPQGCGKTTFVKQAVSECRKHNIRAVDISIDDFYLSRADQESLARKYASCALLQDRGYPGTHDIDLGIKTLKQLTMLRTGETLRIPRYNKSAFQGRGDRFPPDAWPIYQGPFDCILWEGWSMGFASLSHNLPEELKTVNEMLPIYERWYSMINCWLLIVADDFSSIPQWRIEAEEKLRLQSGSGMSELEVKRYIEKFLIAYRTYVPSLREKLSRDEDNLILGMDRQRACREIEGDALE